MNQIPDWFLRLKEEVWNKLSPFIGTPVNHKMCSDVEQEVNKILRDTPQLITHNGQSVQSISITAGQDGRVAITINH